MLQVPRAADVGQAVQQQMYPADQTPQDLGAGCWQAPGQIL